MYPGQPGWDPDHIDLDAIHIPEKNKTCTRKYCEPEEEPKPEQEKKPCPRSFSSSSPSPLIACGGGTAASDCASTSSCPQPKPSVCRIPSRGDVLIPCSGDTPTAQSWVWADTSAQGEVSQRCNAVSCPAGAACLVQSDVSGLDDGGELLYGTCQ